MLIQNVQQTNNNNLQQQTNKIKIQTIKNNNIQKQNNYEGK